MKHFSIGINPLPLLKLEYYFQLIMKVKYYFNYLSPIPLEAISILME